MKNINITLAPKDFTNGETKRISLPEIAFLDYQSAITKLNSKSMDSFKKAYELANVSSKKLISKGANDKMVETIGRINTSDEQIDIKTIAINMVADGLKQYRIPYINELSLEFVPKITDNKVEKVSILLVEKQTTVIFGENEQVTTETTELKANFLSDIDFDNGIIKFDTMQILELIKDSKFNANDIQDSSNKKTLDKMAKINYLIDSNIDLLASSKKLSTLNNLSSEHIVKMVDSMILRIRNAEKVAEIRG